MTEPSRYSVVEPDEVWESFFSVAPLVLVGTLESDGAPDIAPKHQATPLGSHGLFGFVCRPDHSTLRNAVATDCFTVGYPSPSMVVQASLAAAPRDADGAKPTLDLMSLSPARVVSGVLVDGCVAHLECRLVRVIDDLDSDVLVVGRVVAAYIADRARRTPEVEDGALVDTFPALAYLHPGRVAAVHQTKEFPYHRGFHR